MRVLFAVAVFLAPASLFGWGCDGHRIVAFIARAHLTPDVSQEVDRLLRSSPVAASGNRNCPDSPADAMAAVASWADDIRSRVKNGVWHYIDIPRSVTERVSLAPWCPPLALSSEGKDAAGCVVDAIQYFSKILADKTRSDPERAEALRYLIHFTGDIHQPLHDIDDSDQGGNCDPVRFSGDENSTNLHSLWDTRLLQAEMQKASITGTAEFAAILDTRFASLYPALSKEPAGDSESWSWESNALARNVAYGKLEPAVAMVTPGTIVACPDRRQTVGALQIVIGDAYTIPAQRVIDEQLARAGFRLAFLLNSILHN
ncbi:MAG TPA: S1/P1 nuclease [Bryobacteraceae bacterium]|nr:S1/P1 nuclease [Bryobacteraceae bacterium]